MIYTNTQTFTYKKDLLNSFHHMFSGLYGEFAHRQTPHTEDDNYVMIL